MQQIIDIFLNQNLSKIYLLELIQKQRQEILMVNNFSIDELVVWLGQLLQTQAVIWVLTK